MDNETRLSSTFDREPDQYKKIVVDLCGRWNCYPEDLAEQIDTAYQQGTEAAEEVTRLTAELAAVYDAIHDMDVYQVDDTTLIAQYSWSETITAAWELVEEGKYEGCDIHIETDDDNPGQWKCLFWDLAGAKDNRHRATADTAPRAICLAYLQWRENCDKI